MFIYLIMFDTDYDAEVEHFSRMNGWLGKKEKDEYFEQQRIIREQQWEKRENWENNQIRYTRFNKEFGMKQLNNMIERSIKQIGISKQVDKINNMKMSISSVNKEVIEKMKEKEEKKICTNLCDLCIQWCIRVGVCILCIPCVPCCMYVVYNGYTSDEFITMNYE